MRLIPRHRPQRRARLAQIAISQEEITADLHYPAARRELESSRVRGRNIVR